MCLNAAAMPSSKYNAQVIAPPYMKQKVLGDLADFFAESFKTVRASAAHETSESSLSSSSSSRDSEGEKEILLYFGDVMCTS